MYLPPFEYHRPDHVEEVLALLAEHGDEARVYMGGTELLLLMKMGMASPGHLLDAKHVAELRGVVVDGGGLTIGAATTHRDLEHAPAVRDHLPALAAMTRQVGNVRVRAAGTMVGNLCFADPHSDPGALLLALGAEIECRSVAGERRVSAADFTAGPFETVLDDTEMVTRVRVPIPGPDATVVYERIAFRERPVLNVAMVRDGRHWTVVVGGGGRSALRVGVAEEALGGSSDPGDAEVAEAGDACARALDPGGDLDGSSRYKRHLLGVLVTRAAGRCLR